MRMELSSELRGAGQSTGLGGKDLCSNLVIPLTSSPAPNRLHWPVSLASASLDNGSTGRLEGGGREEPGCLTFFASSKKAADPP